MAENKASIDIQVDDTQIEQLTRTLESLSEAFEVLKRESDRATDKLEDAEEAIEDLGEEADDSGRKVGGFERGLAGANRAAAGLGSAARAAGPLVAAAGAAFVAASAAAVGLGAAMFSLTSNMAQVADEAGKMAQGLGITSEALTGLRVAASFSGANVEQLNMALSKINQTIGLAAQGGQTQIDLLNRMGVSATDASGNLTTADVALSQFADTIQELGPGTEATALAIQAFGEQGARLIPLLAGGSEAITDMRAEAERLGAVLDDEATGQAAEFNDAVYRAELAVTGLKNAIAQTLMPSLTEVLNILSGPNGIVTVMNSLASTADDNRDGIRDLVFDAVIVFNEALGVSIELLASAYTAYVELEAIVKTTVSTIQLFGEAVKDAALGPLDNLYRFVNDLDSPLERWLGRTVEIASELEEGRRKADRFSTSIGNLSRTTALLSAELREQKEEGDGATDSMEDQEDAADTLNSSLVTLGTEGVQRLINRYSLLRTGIGDVNDLIKDSLRDTFPLLDALFGDGDDDSGTGPTGSTRRTVESDESPPVSMTPAQDAIALARRLASQASDIASELDQDVAELANMLASSGGLMSEAGREAMMAYLNGYQEALPDTRERINELLLQTLDQVADPEIQGPVRSAYIRELDEVIQLRNEQIEAVREGYDLLIEASRGLDGFNEEVLQQQEQVQLEPLRRSLALNEAQRQDLLERGAEFGVVYTNAALEGSKAYRELELLLLSIHDKSKALKAELTEAPINLDIQGPVNMDLDDKTGGGFGVSPEQYTQQLDFLKAIAAELSEQELAWARANGGVMKYIKTLHDMREETREAFKTTALKGFEDSLGDFATYAGEVLAGTTDELLSGAEKAKKITGMIFGDFLSIIGRTAIAQGFIAALGDPTAGGMPNPGKGAGLVAAGMAAMTAGAAISGKAGSIGAGRTKGGGGGDDTGPAATPSSTPNSPGSTMNVFVENQFGNRFDRRELDRSVADTFDSAIAAGQF